MKTNEMSEEKRNTTFTMIAERETSKNEVD